MMKQLLIFCFWLVFLGNCGKGLAQSSSSNKPLLNQMYAYVQVGPVIQITPDCFPNSIRSSFPLALNLGTGLNLNDHFDLGISTNLAGTNNYFFSNPNQKSFVGTSLHLNYRVKFLILSTELGQAWRYRDGCTNGGLAGFEFRAEDPFIPYYRLTLSVKLLKWFSLYTSWTQSGFAEGKYFYFSSTVYGTGPAVYRTKNLQLGIGYMID